MRTFKVAECCLNCTHRSSRIGKNVVCSIDSKWRSERLICSEYKLTDNKSILGKEKSLLNEEETK